MFGGNVGSVVSVTEWGECASGQREAYAIEEIQQILDSLGENSYVRWALDGCLDDARQNIAEDACFSMKSRWENAEKALEKARELNAEQAEKLHNAEKKVAELEARTLGVNDINTCRVTVRNMIALDENRRNEAADDIVRYAESPTSKEFMHAVAVHRNVVKCLEKLQSLCAVLDKASGKEE